MLTAVWPETAELYKRRSRRRSIQRVADTGYFSYYSSAAIVSNDVKYEPRKIIVRTEGICGGSARIEGTRIPVRLIAALHWRNGHAAEKIAEDYDVTPWQVRQAITYANQHKQEMLDEIRMNELA